MKEAINLSIIVVNYKTPHLTLRCLESIFNSNISISFEVIVVDNYSKDHSKRIIRDKFHKVVWIQSKYNSGFGRGNNLGIIKAKGEYILLLNSDLVVEKNTIQLCFNHFIRDRKSTR